MFRIGLTSHHVGCPIGEDTSALLNEPNSLPVASGNFLFPAPRRWIHCYFKVVILLTSKRFVGKSDADTFFFPDTLALIPNVNRPLRCHLEMDKYGVVGPEQRGREEETTGDKTSQTNDGWLGSKGSLIGGYIGSTRHIILQQHRDSINVEPQDVFDLDMVDGDAFIMVQMDVGTSTLVMEAPTVKIFGADALLNAVFLDTDRSIPGCKIIIR